MVLLLGAYYSTISLACGKGKSVVNVYSEDSIYFAGFCVPITSVVSPHGMLRTADVTVLSFLGN